MSKFDQEPIITRDGPSVRGASDIVSRQINVVDMIKSTSYSNGIEGTINSHWRCPDLYALVAIHPHLTEEERQKYISKYKKEIIYALTSLDLSYIDTLQVTIGYNDTAVHYDPSHFKKLKTNLEAQLGQVLQEQP